MTTLLRDRYGYCAHQLNVRYGHTVSIGHWTLKTTSAVDRSHLISSIKLVVHNYFPIVHILLAKDECNVDHSFLFRTPVSKQMHDVLFNV